MNEFIDIKEENAIETPKFRVEIVCSQALDEDFDEEFKNNNVAKHFTKISNVMGAGFSNPHLGDAVWPQLNSMYVIYCNKDEAEKICSIVLKLRKLYRTEGISCFISKSNELFSI